MWLSDWLRSRNSSPSHEAAKRLRILAVCPGLDDLFSLERLSGRQGWELRASRSVSEAFRLLSDRTFDIVLCDSHQPGRPWREVFARLAKESPGAAVVLIAHAKDDPLWLEVLNQGGFDVLARPLSEEAIERFVAAALLCHPSELRITANRE